MFTTTWFSKDFYNKKLNNLIAMFRNETIYTLEHIKLRWAMKTTKKNSMDVRVVNSLHYPYLPRLLAVKR